GFGRQSAFGDIAVGSDPDIEKASVGAGGQRLGPMMVDNRWQVGDFDRWPTGLYLAVLIVKPHQGILIGDVEIVAYQRQPIGCVEIVGKDRSSFIDAVAIAVPEQGQAIATFDRACSLRLDESGDDVLWRQFRRTATFALGNQN